MPATGLSGLPATGLSGLIGAAVNSAGVLFSIDDFVVSRPPTTCSGDLGKLQKRDTEAEPEAPPFLVNVVH